MRRIQRHHGNRYRNRNPTSATLDSTGFPSIIRFKVGFFGVFCDLLLACHLVWRLKFRIAGHGPVFISRPGGPCPSESSYEDSRNPVTSRYLIGSGLSRRIRAYKSDIILLKFQVTTFERHGDSFLRGKSLSDSEILTIFLIPGRTDCPRELRDRAATGRDRADMLVIR